MASIELRGVTVRFRDGPPALAGVDLRVEDGELAVVTGPSGSGKTTLLRVVAGLTAPNEGTVWLGDREVTHLEPSKRDLAMVFQGYALQPQRTAEGNIEFPLLARGVSPESERKRRVRAEARHLSIEHILARKPGELSAGHRQAVATARSLVRSSEALLMDEPLSNLDARARTEGRVEVKRVHRELGATLLYVTNDQAEAMSLADRLAVVAAGRIQQFDRPLIVYEHPANTMVAGFLGTPPMALVPGELARSGDMIELLIGTDRLHLGGEALSGFPDHPEWLGLPILVGIRPECLIPASGAEPFARTLHGRVGEVEDLATEVIVHVELGVRGVEVQMRMRPPVRVHAGDPIEVAVAQSRLRFFDPETGAACRPPPPASAHAR